MIFLWLIFGSLGSVVMTRFSDGITWKKLRGFFFGRSQCPDCKHPLQAKNLVPVVSYFIQWGKCEYCKKKISRIYPVVELLCAGIFVATYFLLKDFWIKTLVFWLLTNRLLILLLIYDLWKYELHMIARILLMTIWIVANINISGGNDWNFLMSTIMFGVTFSLIYLFAKRYVKIRFKKNVEWFGQGDVYLAIAIWLLIPIVLSIQWIQFSWWMLANVLILFTLLSSIIGLIRAWLQYCFTKIFGIWDKGLGTWKKLLSSSLVPGSSLLNVIPFFPAMIITFWIMSRKLPFLLTSIFTPFTHFPW